MKAFISYSHHDADLLEAFHRHLAALRRQNLITTWTDREIPAGGVIDEHVDHHIEDADLYLLLVSASFLDSNYCYEREFKRALERYEAKEALIVPVIVKPCDWLVPELKKFKALPKDGRAVTSSHWKSVDEALTDVVSGIRKVIKRGNAEPVRKFVPDERHISEDQRATLKKIGDEVAERLTAHLATKTDEERKKKIGMYHGIMWKGFGEEFGLDHGLKSLPAEAFQAARDWLIQYRGMNDNRLKRSNPQKFRAALLRTIWSIANGKDGLGWNQDQVHAFAADKVSYAAPLESLNELGNKQLETVRDRIRYEATKRGVRRSQAKARRSKPLKVRQFVADLRKEDRSKPVCFCSDPRGLQFYRFKMRGAQLLQIELNENVCRDDEGRVCVDSLELLANFDPNEDPKTVGQLLDSLSDKTIQHYELIFGGDHEALKYVGLRDFCEWVSIEFEAKVTRAKDGFIVEEMRGDTHVREHWPFAKEIDPESEDILRKSLRAQIERGLINPEPSSVGQSRPVSNRVSYEEQTAFNELFKDAAQVKVAVTTYSVRFSKVLGDDTEDVMWFDDALHKAGVVTQLHCWESFGQVPDGAHVCWAKGAQNNEMVRRLREAASLRGLALRDAPRGITKGYEIEIMVGRRNEQGPLSASVQRDIETFVEDNKEKELLSQKLQEERLARLALIPKRIITLDQETQMLKLLQEQQISPVVICMPMGDGNDFAIRLAGIFKKARINVGQCAIGLDDEFPTGVRLFWTADGNNSRDSGVISRAIELTGVQCIPAERQLSESVDILQQFQIHLYVGASITPPLQTPFAATRESLR